MIFLTIIVCKIQNYTCVGGGWKQQRLSVACRRDISWVLCCTTFVLSLIDLKLKHGDDAVLFYGRNGVTEIQ